MSYYAELKSYIRVAIFYLVVFWFLTSINLAQSYGLLLYPLSRRWYHRYQAYFKGVFGLLITYTTYFSSSTHVRISGDKSMINSIHVHEDGVLKCEFTDRLVLIANHQIYTDWLYLWWISYSANRHRDIFIILKKSLRKIPIIGPGMIFFSFIFISRNWKSDEPLMNRKLELLNRNVITRTSDLQSKTCDPMWLLLFPEGTNNSSRGRSKSAEWAAKKNQSDLKHLIMPRKTGLFFSLRKLRTTVDWLYDCTIAYEGVPLGKYAQDIFTFNSICARGRPPKIVNMYWRRFPLSTIPLEDPNQFELWLEQQWREKDDLIQHYHQYGQFPAFENDKDRAHAFANDWIETRVQLKNKYEILTLAGLVVIPWAVTYACVRAALNQIQ